jgi:hypothetical protein
MMKNKMKINNLIFTCGLVIGTLSVSTPWESAIDVSADDTSSTSAPVSKQPASKKKTYLPKPPSIRIV